MLYGLFSEPTTILEDMVGITQVVPPQAALLINDQLSNLIRIAAATHGLAVIPAVLLALYGASGAARGIISSLNVIYEQKEKRSILYLFGLAVAISVGAVILAVLGLLAVSVTAFLQSLVAGISPIVTLLLRAGTWLLAAGLVTTILTLVYRYGPCRALAKWRWLSLGSASATLLWLAGSLLFGWYVSAAGYETTYGSLGTVVAVIMWMYVSAYAMLLGAFLDAEAERQTARDSTTGKPLPLGERGAIMADSSAALKDHSP